MTDNNLLDPLISTCVRVNGYKNPFSHLSYVRFDGAFLESSPMCIVVQYPQSKANDFQNELKLYRASYNKESEQREVQFNVMMQAFADVEKEKYTKTFTGPYEDKMIDISEHYYPFYNIDFIYTHYRPKDAKQVCITYQVSRRDEVTKLLDEYKKTLTEHKL